MFGSSRSVRRSGGGGASCGAPDGSCRVVCRFMVGKLPERIDAGPTRDLTPWSKSGPGLRLFRRCHTGRRTSPFGFGIQSISGDQGSWTEGRPSAEVASRTTGNKGHGLGRPGVSHEPALGDRECCYHAGDREAAEEGPGRVRSPLIQSVRDVPRRASAEVHPVLGSVAQLG